MGYDCILYRTRDKEIEIEERTVLKEYETKNDGIKYYSDIEREVKAQEVLWLHKAYWLGNIIEEKGIETKYFIYLSKNNLNDILRKSKECLKERNEYLVNRYFHTGALSSYEEFVIWEQFAQFNRVMGNLLRNNKDIHYWYLKQY